VKGLKAVYRLQFSVFGEKVGNEFVEFYHEKPNPPKSPFAKGGL
jgi:hypothetical protein